MRKSRGLSNYIARISHKNLDLLTKHIEPHVHGDRLADVVVRRALVHARLLPLDPFQRQNRPLANLGRRFAGTALLGEKIKICEGISR